MLGTPPGLISCRPHPGGLLGGGRIEDGGGLLEGGDCMEDGAGLLEGEDWEMEGAYQEAGGGGGHWGKEKA